MKVAGILMLAVCMPYAVWADSSAAAASAAAASDGNGSSVAAAAASASTSSSEPHRSIRCPCKTHYAPVCGTDGYTYSNECMLRCVSNDNMGNDRSSIGVFYDGECETPYMCPQAYEPICGCNNKTYNNECYLGAENKIRKRNNLNEILIAYRTACQAPTCVCPDAIVPVCGSDGRTYRNVCLMQCYSRINQAKGLSAIKLRESNACKREKCYCSAQKKEICASDETTYLNECVLKCQNRRRDQLGQKPLKIQYRNRCVKCSCNKKYEPVCGSSDVTFPNHCEFLCENRRRHAGKRPLLFVRWSGRCDCGCSNAYKPVCATNDGKTYHTFQNICSLNCLNRKLTQDKKVQMRLVRYGRCRLREP